MLLYGKLAAILEDQERFYDLIEDMRNNFDPLRVYKVRVNSWDELVRRAGELTNAVLRIVEAAGGDFGRNPGHGIGHILRDYINAHILMHRLQEIPLRDRFIGLCTGVLHDIGCAVVPRYMEKDALIRHAEAGAILSYWILTEYTYLVNDAERDCICYAIAAHTCYMREFTVCYNGTEHKIEPYSDTVEGKPIWWVWLPRWVDRLDCNGPCLVARHFLTLVEDHYEYDGREFYKVKLERHLEPIIRDGQADGKTMLEHLKMFADSQHNDSPYGRFDIGFMRELRDWERSMLYRILDAKNHPLPWGEARLTIEAWFEFLKEVEPSRTGTLAAERLKAAFSELDEDLKVIWAAIFAETMRQYTAWQRDVTKMFRSLKLSLDGGHYLAPFLKE